MHCRILPGQSAHIGLAVTAYLGLVPHASEGYPDEGPAQGARYGLAQGGLAGARGAYEAEDGALDVRVELPHGDELQDPLLGLLHAVVILVQDGACAVQVPVVLGLRGPGQVRHPFAVAYGGRRLPETGPGASEAAPAPFAPCRRPLPVGTWPLSAFRARPARPRLRPCPAPC